MKALYLALAFSVASMPGMAQTMDPAVIETDAAGSASGVIVPLLGLLLLLAVVSGPSNTPLPPG